MIKTKSALSDNQMVVRAIKDSFIKLSPKVQAENPVMLLVYISAILTSLLWVASLSGVQDVSSGYTLAIAIILWLTCILLILLKLLLKAGARHRLMHFVQLKKM